MLFETELFASPLFGTSAPPNINPVTIFAVSRSDAGTPYTFISPVKDPDSIEFHGMDWSGWLQNGDSIASQTVFAAAEGITISEVSRAAAVISWRLSGGQAGQDYVVTCRVTTAGGLVDDRSIRYRVRER